MGEIVEVSRKDLKIHKGFIAPIVVKLAHIEKMDYFQDIIKDLEAELEEARTGAEELVALRTFRGMISPTCPRNLKIVSLFSCVGAIRRGECRSCKPRENIIHALSPRPRS